MTRKNALRQAGFTLLEVMIALGIFGICATILLKQSGLSARQSSYLDQKTQAIWIAENKLAELRLKTDWPSIGNTTEAVIQRQREWEVITNTSATSNPDLRRVHVSVNVDGADSITTLTGYIGKH